MTDHSHHGVYADNRHYHDVDDHYHDYAERDHQHYDAENITQGLREDLSRAESRISDLEARLDALEVTP